MASIEQLGSVDAERSRSSRWTCQHYLYVDLLTLLICGPTNTPYMWTYQHDGYGPASTTDVWACRRDLYTGLSALLICLADGAANTTYMCNIACGGMCDDMHDDTLHGGGVYDGMRDDVCGRKRALMPLYNENVR